MTTSPNLPKLYAQDLPSLLDWAARIIVFFEQEAETETVAAPPVGAMMDLASPGATAPEGWFLADGTAYAEASYPELFAVLGTTFNTGGEPADTFRVPVATVTIAGVAGCKRIIRHD